MTIELTESLLATTIYVLARAESPQSLEVLRDFRRQGVRLPVWVLETLDMIDNPLPTPTP